MRSLFIFALVFAASFALCSCVAGNGQTSAPATTAGTASPEKTADAEPTPTEPTPTALTNSETDASGETEEDDPFVRLFDKALSSDGAYAEAAADELRKAFLADPDGWVSALTAWRCEKENAKERICGLLVYAQSYFELDDLEEQILQMKTDDRSLEETATLDLALGAIGWYKEQGY